MRKNLFKASALILIMFLLFTGCDRRVVSSSEEQSQNTQTVSRLYISAAQPILYVNYAQSSVVDTLLVTALNSRSLAIPGVEIDISLVAGSDGALALAGADTVTNAQGQIKYIYQTIQGMDITEDFIVSIAAQAGSALDTTTIEVRHQVLTSLTMQASPQIQIVPEDSTRDYQIRAQVTGQNGNGMAGVMVNFGLNPPGNGVITSSAQADASGLALATFTSGVDQNGTTIYDSTWVSGTVTDPAAEITLTNQTFVITESESSEMNLEIISPLSGPIYTDPSNTDETEFRAQLTLNGHAIANQIIHWSASLGIITGVSTTNEQGVATAYFISVNTTGTLTVTATYGSLEDIRTYQVLQGIGDPAEIVLESQYQSLPQEGGVISSLITATVYDPLNNLVGSGTNVRFRTTLGGISPLGTTDENGQCSSLFQMGTSSGLAEITATVYVGADSITTSTFINLNAGIPANIVLLANNPVIEIMGSGAMSQTPVHAQVLDPSGYAVSEEVQVAFSIVTAPDSVSMSIAGDSNRYWYRALSGSDTLIVNTTNGTATVSVNSWKRPGVVMMQAYVVEYPAVISQRALITIVSGPPTYGYVDRNAVGIQLGAGLWEIEWAAHFWDQFSNDVRDSTAVYFHVVPENIASIGCDAFTGNESRAGETHPGIAFTDMIYASGVTGDTLFLVEACCAGLVLEDPEDPESPLVPGDLCIAFDAPFFILPFQPGDLGQNLTVQGSTDALQFEHPDIAGAPEYLDVTIQSLIVDGYNTPVHNQIIQFFSSSPSNTEWDPPVGNNIGISDDQGMVVKTLRVYQTVCENMWTFCGTSEIYEQYAPFTLNVWAVQLPDGLQSNQWTIQCSTPCPPGL